MFYSDENELPLSRPLPHYSRTSIFRKVAFVGDSLASGEFETLDAEGKRGYHDLYEYSWGQFMARRNGFTAYNFSRGGMTAKEYMESFAEARGFWNEELRAQAYVIALGVNDICNAKREIGSVADIDPTDYHNNKPTFIGHYAQIVARYKQISPNAKFFFVTVPRHKPFLGCPLAEIRDALAALTEHFDNSYLIDLYTYAPEFDEKFCERYFLLGHMSPEGYLVMAEMIDSYIDYIIRHNYDDFRYVGLDGAGIAH